eukprot:scaffold1967_cov199-Alexandrium_tamarense.AAC.43
MRSVWQEVIRQVPSEDPNKAGSMTFEDPDLADMRMGRANRAEVTSLYRVLIPRPSNPQHLYEEEQNLSDTKRDGCNANVSRWNVDT